jgi:hypothetical protein
MYNSVATAATVATDVTVAPVATEAMRPAGCGSIGTRRYAGDADDRKSMMAHRRTKQEAEARVAKLKARASGRDARARKHTRQHAHAGGAQEKAKADVEQRRKKAKLALSAATVRYNDARAKVRGRAGGAAPQSVVRSSASAQWSAGSAVGSGEYSVVVGGR